MKVKPLLAVVLSFVLCSCVAFAEGNMPFWGKITKDEINLRADAGINSQILKKLPKGFVVKVIDSAYEWYKVSLPLDVKAYVYKKYVSIEGHSVVITGNSVNVRACAGIQCPILGQADEGDKFRLCGEKDNWVCVFGGKNLHAWVHKRFVEPVNRTALSAQKEPKKQVMEPLEKEQRADVNVVEQSVKQAEVKEEAADNKQSKDMPIAIGLLAKVKASGKYAYAIMDGDGRILYWLDGRDILFRIFKGDGVKVFGKIKDKTYRDLPVIKVKKIERVK